MLDTFSFPPFFSVNQLQSINVVKFYLSQVKRETMLVSSLPLFRSCAVVWGLLGVMWFYSVAFEVNSLSPAFCSVSTVLSDFAPCSPSLSGKYEVSIMVPLFLQCDGAWWLPLTGLSWLPYNSALVHRVLMVTLYAWLLCLRLHYLSRHLPQAHLLLLI